MSVVPFNTSSSQQELERLLKQGRVYLQDLRSRLQQTTAERDRLQAELAERTTAHQHTVEQLERQMDGLRAELQGAADERRTFTRSLDEASAIQRELTQEVQEQRQQIHALRESAMRAQSFARDIIRAHETLTPLPDQKPE